jgi:hypothetical protein
MHTGSLVKTIWHVSYAYKLCLVASKPSGACSLKRQYFIAILLCDADGTAIKMQFTNHPGCLQNRLNAMCVCTWFESA